MHTAAHTPLGPAAATATGRVHVAAGRVKVQLLLLLALSLLVAVAPAPAHAQLTSIDGPYIEVIEHIGQSFPGTLRIRTEFRRIVIRDCIIKGSLQIYARPGALWPDRTVLIDNNTVGTDAPGDQAQGALSVNGANLPSGPELWNTTTVRITNNVARIVHIGYLAFRSTGSTVAIVGNRVVYDAWSSSDRIYLARIVSSAAYVVTVEGSVALRPTCALLIADNTVASPWSYSRKSTSGTSTSNRAGVHVDYADLDDGAALNVSSNIFVAHATMPRNTTHRLQTPSGLQTASASDAIVLGNSNAFEAATLLVLHNDVRELTPAPRYAYYLRGSHTRSIVRIVSDAATNAGFACDTRETPRRQDWDLDIAELAIALRQVFAPTVDSYLRFSHGATRVRNFTFYVREMHVFSAIVGQRRTDTPSNAWEINTTRFIVEHLVTHPRALQRYAKSFYVSGLRLLPSDGDVGPRTRLRHADGSVQTVRGAVYIGGGATANMGDGSVALRPAVYHDEVALSFEACIFDGVVATVQDVIGSHIAFRSGSMRNGATIVIQQCNLTVGVRQTDYRIVFDGGFSAVDSAIHIHGNAIRQVVPYEQFGSGAVRQYAAVHVTQATFEGTALAVFDNIFPNFTESALVRRAVAPQLVWLTPDVSIRGASRIHIGPNAYSVPEHHLLQRVEPASVQALFLPAAAAIQRWVNTTPWETHAYDSASELPSLYVHATAATNAATAYSRLTHTIHVVLTSAYTALRSVVIVARDVPRLQFNGITFAQNARITERFEVDFARVSLIATMRFSVSDKPQTSPFDPGCTFLINLTDVADEDNTCYGIDLHGISIAAPPPSLQPKLDALYRGGGVGAWAQSRARDQATEPAGIGDSGAFTSRATVSLRNSRIQRLFILASNLSYVLFDLHNATLGCRPAQRSLVEVADSVFDSCAVVVREGNHHLPQAPGAPRSGVSAEGVLHLAPGSVVMHGSLFSLIGAAFTSWVPTHSGTASIVVVDMNAVFAAHSAVRLRDVSIERSQLRGDVVYVSPLAKVDVATVAVALHSVHVTAHTFNERIRVFGGLGRFAVVNLSMMQDTLADAIAAGPAPSAVPPALRYGVCNEIVRSGGSVPITSVENLTQYACDDATYAPCLAAGPTAASSSRCLATGPPDVAHDGPPPLPDLPAWRLGVDVLLPPLLEVGQASPNAAHWGDGVQDPGRRTATWTAVQPRTATPTRAVAEDRTRTADATPPATTAAATPPPSAGNATTAAATPTPPPPPATATRHLDATITAALHVRSATTTVRRSDRTASAGDPGSSFASTPDDDEPAALAPATVTASATAAAALGVAGGGAAASDAQLLVLFATMSCADPSLKKAVGGGKRIAFPASFGPDATSNVAGALAASCALVLLHAVATAAAASVKFKGSTTFAAAAAVLKFPSLSLVGVRFLLPGLAQASAAQLVAPAAARTGLGSILGALGLAVSVGTIAGAVFVARMARRAGSTLATTEERQHSGGEAAVPLVAPAAAAASAGDAGPPSAAAPTSWNRFWLSWSDVHHTRCDAEQALHSSAQPQQATAVAAEANQVGAFSSTVFPAGFWSLPPRLAGLAVFINALRSPTSMWFAPVPWLRLVAFSVVAGIDFRGLGGSGACKLQFALLAAVPVVFAAVLLVKHPLRHPLANGLGALSQAGVTFVGVTQLLRQFDDEDNGDGGGRQPAPRGGGSSLVGIALSVTMAAAGAQALHAVAMLLLQRFRWSKQIQRAAVDRAAAASTSAPPPPGAAASVLVVPTSAAAATSAPPTANPLDQRTQQPA